MIYVEFLREQSMEGVRKVKQPAIKFTVNGEHLLRANDVIPLFNWEQEGVISKKKSCAQVVFDHWLGAEAIYQYEILNRQGQRSWWETSSLSLVPLEAFLSVESLLRRVADYVSVKYPDAKVTWEDIIGTEKLLARARELYPNRA